MTRRALRICAIALFILALGNPTHAQEEGERDRARALFVAGAQAYKDGDFPAAVQAFQAAHALSPKTDLLFAIGQAARRQFHVSREDRYLRAAVDNFRDYLERTPTGGRRLEAAQALGELAPYAVKLEAEAATPAEPQLPSRLMLTSPTKGAVVQIDGGAVHAVPLSLTLDQGPHKVEVRASGHFAEERAFVVERGDVIALDVALKGRPAELMVTGADGAEIAIDGRNVAASPTAEPITIAAGQHLVTVTKNGHDPYAQEMSFAHGSKTELAVSLPRTGRRHASYGLFAGAGATATASAAFAIVALVADADANAIRDEQRQGNISEAQRAAHNDAVERLRVAAPVAGTLVGISAALAITGTILFLFDQPDLPSRRPFVPDREDDAEPSPPDLDVLGFNHGIGLGLRGEF